MASILFGVSVVRGFGVSVLCGHDSGEPEGFVQLKGAVENAGL